MMYCRLPGLLAQAARGKHGTSVCGPLVVVDGRIVRDACSLALTAGVKVGAGVVQARRLCPMLLAVPLKGVDARRATSLFLDILAALSPVVEPVRPDAAYVDLTGLDARDAGTALEVSSQQVLGLRPVLGFGPCRLAARACAECVLPPGCLSKADVAWLWPEDQAVIARLKRLGLDTFGRRAALWSLPVLHQDRNGQKRRATHAEATGQGALDLPEPDALAVGLPDFSAEGRYAREWTALGFSPEGHPLAPYREELAAQGILPCAALRDAKPGSPMTLAGLVLRPHRPPTAGGMAFFTLEDEGGMA